MSRSSVGQPWSGYDYNTLAADLDALTLSEYNGEPHGLIVTSPDRLNDELLQFIGATKDPTTDPNLA